MATEHGEPGLQAMPADAIVPPLMLELAEDDVRPAPSRLWVRATLAAIGLAWLGVFAVAAMLSPYRGGEPLLEETHRQLGLPPCTFKAMTDLPCPSCGMTTSFSHLVRGNVVHALRANFAGAVLALLGLVYLPWSLASMWRGRWLWFDNIEVWLVRIIFAWVMLMLLRWAAVLAYWKWMS